MKEIKNVVVHLCEYPYLYKNIGDFTAFSNLASSLNRWQHLSLTIPKGGEKYCNEDGAKKRQSNLLAGLPPNTTKYPADKMPYLSVHLVIQQDKVRAELTRFPFFNAG